MFEIVYKKKKNSYIFLKLCLVSRKLKEKCKKKLNKIKRKCKKEKNVRKKNFNLINYFYYIYTIKYF